MSNEERLAEEASRVRITTVVGDRTVILAEYQYDIRQWLYTQAHQYRRIADGKYAADMHHIRSSLMQRARLCEYLAGSVGDTMSVADWNNGQQWMTIIETDDDDTDLYVEDIFNAIVTNTHPNNTDTTPK